MIIKCTPEEVIEMGKLAVLASQPVGMGFLHYQAGLKKEEIQFADFELRSDSLSIDYYQGRMVKFNGRKVANGWEFADVITPDYQSWMRHYPSYKDLYEAAIKENK